ncbi:MAG: exodeoxyribonuclease VII large subunit [Rhizobium sp.]|nr:MAG: exodeoxyribonuclease VII large subunit [Rhizobium sp.]
MPDALGMNTNLKTRADAPEAMTLATYISGIALAVKRTAAAPTWIVAEISALSCKNGHYYIDLVGPRDHPQRPQAKCRAYLWQTRAQSILPRFKAQTGSDLKTSMSVMVLVRAELDATYGFSVVIEDIDGRFTLGEQEAQLRRMRESLTASGDYRRQASLSLPCEYTRVAVIAPAGAAGLGDFKVESDRLAALGLCEFRVFQGSFQGSRAEAELLSAVDRVLESGPYDAVAVIRGGGAAADLRELNIESLARALARLPYPVLTGIGHERDRGLLDEIAHKAFDTPSKLAFHFRDVVLASAQAGAESVAEMKRALGALADSVRQRSVRDEADVVHGIRRLVTRAGQVAAEMDAQAPLAVAKSVSETRRRLANGQDILGSEVRRILAGARAGAAHAHAGANDAVVALMKSGRQAAERATGEFCEGIRKASAAAFDQARLLQSECDTFSLRHIANARREAELCFFAMDAISPERQLALGYSVVRDEQGRIVRSVKAAKAASAVTVEVADGTFRATLNA